MIRCEDALARMVGYLAGSLPADEAARVREHVAGCDHCREVASSEEALQRGLVQATVEQGSASHVMDLLGRARARAEGPASPRGRWRRLLIAALVFLAVGMGLMVALGPPCLRGGCPTMRMLLDAAALSDAPMPGTLPDLGIPEVPGLSPAGVGQVEGMTGAVPVAVYADGATRLVVFRSPDAHTHFWQVDRLADGREYVDRALGGRRVVGWADETGRVWACVSVDGPRALELALDLRRRSS